MLKSFRIPSAQILAVCLCLAIGFAGPAAARSALTDKKGILQYVPDDTPYILAAGEPLPDKLLDRMEPRFDEMLKAYQVFFREIIRSSMAKNSGDMGAEEIQRTSAIVDEFMALFSIEGLRNAGFERDSGLVLFGNGMLPVLRIELSDPDKFDGVIERLEAAAGESMKTADIGGVTYRYVGDEEARLIIGVFSGDAVFTVAPGVLDEDQLKVLLGLTPPKKSIARSGLLLDIVKEYDFSEHYVGFIDNLRIASIFLDDPQGLDAALVDSAEYDPETVSKICKQEIREIVGIAPRMVFGYGEIGSEQLSGSLIVEMRADIAQGLSTLSALVPGLGIDPGGLLSFGMSLNIPAVYKFAEARLDAMEEDPFECEHFSELQAGVAKGRETLAKPLPPFISGMRGFNLIVDSLGDYDMGGGAPPENIDASVVLSMDDAQAVFMMGTMMSPDLAAVDLQPDGVPVPLALPQLQAIAKSAYAAMAETALAISMGSEARTRVTAVLHAHSADPPPIMSASMDAGTYYELVSQSMMAEQDEEGNENPLPESARVALRDAVLAMGKMYDRMAFDVRFTARGIEMHSKVSLHE
jgi:hypothetical protein